MSASFLPSIFVPIVGLIFPFVTLGLFFRYIEKEKIS
uniref:Photosystem I reaction center subunit VIII n=1 Tax=Monomorphina aenigmatica TaxID=304863 RepID=L0BGG1_MONAE|nr:photosystem I subunit VIII [Monomorphina aenigmatica]AFZ88777.1 photosystem I subunit VIII [Monomorphina aenigmatica]